MLKESDNLDVLAVTFDSMITFEKNLPSVPRTASEMLGILRESWRVFRDRSLFGSCFRGLSCQFWSTVLQCDALLQIHTSNHWTV